MAWWLRRSFGLAGLAALVLAAAVPDRSAPVELPTCAVIVSGRGSRRRCVVRRGGRCTPAETKVWLVRRWLRQSMVAGLVLAVNAGGEGGWWVAAGAAVLWGVREAALWRCLTYGSLQSVGWFRALARPVRILLWVGLVWGLASGMGGVLCDGPMAACLGTVAGGEAAGPRAHVEVRNGLMRVTLAGPATLELRIGGEQDERLGIILCRQFLDLAGSALLTHQAIATAFGKKDRRDCQNHLQQFERAGKSLAHLIRDGWQGRKSRVHPAIQKLIAEYWQRHPLAEMEETHRWLVEHGAPAGVRLPTLKSLQRMRRVEGNLVAMRGTVRRLLTRDADRVALRSEVQFRQLLEVVDRQDRCLHDAGAAGPELTEEVARLAASAARMVSRTSARLMATLHSLLVRPSPAEDERLAETLGQRSTAPLHYGVLYCVLGLSIGQIAALVGRGKSAVYRALAALGQAVEVLDPFPAYRHFSGVLTIDEKWVLVPKSFSKEERGTGKKWRYVFFAVDGLTGDLLHIDVFDAVSSRNLRTFLAAVRARGIRPRAVVTDMLASYETAIRETFGNSVLHHYCLFHHLQAVRHWLTKHCGKDWRRHPLLCELVSRVDYIYKCRDRRTATKRLDQVTNLRDKLAQYHPDALPLLDIIAERFPMVANALGRADLPMTNDITERTIKAFHRHYRGMAGFEAIATARIQADLFRFFYRLTPMPEAVRKEHRGLCPLERAGWELTGIPMADYIRRFTQAWDMDGPESLVGSECTPLAGPADKQEAQPVGPSPPAASEPGCEEVPLRVAA